MRRLILAAVVAASAATSACGQMHDGGSGANVSRNYQVGNFQQIEVAGPYDVDVRTGGNPSVSAQGSQKLLDRTIVEVQGDKLVIHQQEQHGLHFTFNNHGNAHLTVTVPQLSGATVAGSGDMRVDRAQGAAFAGAVAGSGQLNIDNVDVQALKLSIGGSGSLKAAAGKAQSADYSIGGSGDVDARRSPDAAGKGVDRRFGKREGERDCNRRRQHHGFGRCRRVGRREVHGEQGGLGQRQLLLKGS